jgi:hypothetical protein
MSAESQELPIKSSPMNDLIATIVAIAASLMAVCNIKDNNIVQAMSQAQAHTIDHWSHYQSKSTKQSLVENQIDLLEMQLSLNPKAEASAKKNIETQIQKNKEKFERYEKEKTELKAQAEASQVEYDSLNIHDDQFDLAEALLSLGLSLFGITALTQKKSLFVFAAVLSGIGVVFGLAGFLGWSIHPEWLTRLLG